MRGKWLLFGGVTILAAVLAGVEAMYRQSKPAPKAAAPVQAVTPPALGPELSITGKVQAQRVVTVPVTVEGTVDSFSVDVGDDVTEGQLLALIKSVKAESLVQSSTEELDKAQGRVQDTEAAIIAARLEASRARADAVRARAEYDRLSKAYSRQKMLMAEGATPRLTFEKIEHEYNTAKDEDESKEALARQADDRVLQLNRDLDTFKRMLSERTDTLEQAKENLDAGAVRSPVDGVIIGRHGQAGEQVNPSIQDLFRIAAASSAMEVVLQPASADLPRIHSGQPASIRIAEVVNEPISGTVREINGGVVVVEFTSPTPLIKPGVSAQVTIKVG